MEREKIIQYLQEIKCEWFPVEWDSFALEYLQAVGSQGEERALKNKIRYNPGDLGYYVIFQEHMGQMSKEYWKYSTFSRLKTLLINAVRSIDEPKRIAAGQKYFKYVIGANDEWIRIFCQSRKGGSYEIVWQDGEFK